MDPNDFGDLAATAEPRQSKRLTIKDPGCRGLYVRVTPTGGRTWTVMTRSPDGKQVWRSIGEVGLVSLDAARDAARELRLRIKAGERIGRATVRVAAPIPSGVLEIVPRKSRKPRSMRKVRSAEVAGPWTKYGLSEQEYGALHQRQGGKCALCRGEAAANRHGRLYIDHCHSSGEVRGLLCAKCNSMLGFARDDGRVLRRAAAYLASGEKAVRLTRAALRWSHILMRVTTRAPLQEAPRDGAKMARRRLAARPGSILCATLEG